MPCRRRCRSLGFRPPGEVSPEELLLDQAALADVITRAARRPGIGGRRQHLPDPAPADDAPQATGEAARLLDLLLSQPPVGQELRTRLVVDWLQFAARAGRRFRTVCSRPCWPWPRHEAGGGGAAVSCHRRPGPLATGRRVARLPVTLPRTGGHRRAEPKRPTLQRNLSGSGAATRPLPGTGCTRTGMGSAPGNAPPSWASLPPTSARMTKTCSSGTGRKSQDCPGRRRRAA